MKTDNGSHAKSNPPKEKIEDEILQALPQGVAALDDQGYFVYVNSTFAHMVGHPPGFFVGSALAETTLFGGLPKQDEIRTWHRYEETKEQNVQLCRADGRTQPVRLTRIPRWQAGQVVGVILFLTEMPKYQEKELAWQASEGQYDSLIEFSPDPIGVHREGEFIFVNAAAAALFGIASRHELKGKMLGDFVHPDDHLYMRDHPRQLRQQGKPPLTELRVIRPDGSIRHVEAMSNPILYEEQEATLFVVRDISERKQTEAIYRILVNNPLQGILIIQDWRVVFANPRATEISGYTTAELLDMSPDEFLACIHPADREAVAIRLAAHLANEPAPSAMQFCILHKEAQLRWVEVYTRHILFQGRPAAQVVYLDITERYIAAQKLRESEAKHRMLLNCISSPIVALNKELKILYCNEAYSEFVGRSVEHIEGQKLQDILPHFVTTEAYAAYQKALTTQEKQEAEGPIGGSYWQTRIYPTPWGILAVADDVSSHKQAEDNVRREKLFSDALIESLPGIFYVLNEQNRFVRWNKDLEQISGYSAEELAQLDPFCMVVTTEEKLARTRLQELMSRGQVDTELHLVGRGGRETPFYLTGRRMVLDEQAFLVGVGIDLTERKHLEEKLHQSEEHFRFVVNSVRDVIFQTDAQGLWIFLNPAWEEITGWSVAESLEQNFLNYVHPDDRERNTAEFIPLIERRKSYCRHEVRYLTKEGGFRWIEVHARLTIDREGNTTGTAGLLRDVTERKEREINAREQLNAERRLHQEIEAVQQAGLSLIISLDLHQVFSSILKTLYDLFPVRVADIFLYENDTLTFGLGMRPEGLTTQPYSVPRQDGFTYTVARSAQPSFIEDNAQHPVLKHIRPAWEQFSTAGLPLLIKSEVVGVMDVSYDAPHYFSEKEKQLLQLLAVYAAIAVQNARLHGQVQHQTELLEQRVAERTAELEQERSWLRTILDTAGEAIYFADADKVIRYANAMTERLTGYPADELVGQPHHLLRGTLDTITQQTVATTLARGDVWQGEVLNRHKEGRLYDANVTLSPVRNTHHDVVGYVGIERDITQTKELYRLREQFVSRIGHELRTPLTNLQVYVQLLKHGQPDKQARYIAVLEETTTRLRKLIEGFMELSALSVDAAPVQLTPVDAHEVVMHLIQGEQMKSRAHHLALVYKPGGELTSVLAESALLRQLMARLLENAFDYTPANGQVTVTMTRELWQGQEWVVIAVQDTGPGIVAAELPHIFDRFFRGNAAADYTVAGAGLGLAICQEIIQKLGGRLTVASTVGVGTIFYVWLQPASAPFN